MVMLEVTVAAPLLLDRVTRTPPAGAGALKVTVPVEPLPPVTEFGDRETPLIAAGPGAGGLIVRPAPEELAELAVMVALTVEATAVVETLKPPLDCPAAMVMLAGTVAAALLLARVTMTPPAGAGALRFTVPLEELPPTSVDGDSETLLIVPWTGAGGLIVRPAPEELAELAVMVALTVEATAVVDTLKPPLDCPAAMVMLAGTVAAALLLARVTRTPPAGAGALRFTVPLEEFPPTSVDGESETLLIVPWTGAGGLIVRPAPEELAELAVMVALTVEATAVVETLKPPLDCPAAMVMLAGTVAAALLLDRVTRTPPAGAGALRLTVPLEELPPTSVDGERETLLIVPWTGAGGLIVRPAEPELAEVAVIVALAVEATTVVVTANVPVVSPAAMVMLAGTVAAALLLERLTRTPPAAAGALRVTVPVEPEPPVTVEGERPTLPMLPVPTGGGLMVRPAEPELAEVAVIVALAVEATTVVVTENVPLDCPAAMVMLAGTVAAALLLERLTRTPPAAAGALRVTVHEDEGYGELVPGRYLKLEVSDTGSGINPEIKERIFEPYFTSKEVGAGTGLGLSMALGIVKSCHGHITVYSEAGKGATFRVYLPLLAQKSAKTPGNMGMGEPQGKGERILFVDDEAPIRELADRLFSLHGYQVIPCTNGLQALAEFQNHPGKYDLVITDMTMPQMTGSELAKKILAIKPDMPIILCTGQSELIDQEKALAMGICDYLTKPVIKQDFLAAIRKAIDSHPQPH